MNISVVTRTLAVFYLFALTDLTSHCTWQFAGMNNEVIIHNRLQYNNIKSMLEWHAYSEWFSHILCYSCILNLKLALVTSVT